jgi:hypothetical protein
MSNQLQVIGSGEDFAYLLESCEMDSGLVAKLNFCLPENCSFYVIWNVRITLYMMLYAVGTLSCVLTFGCFCFTTILSESEMIPLLFFNVLLKAPSGSKRCNYRFPSR